ncbi:hypothetical protein HGP16_25365 [Rhizobium sp. P40RR-XXII]|uniref:hypothetical protein n=1 Tax=Rhizobium sp. P40RR-XXII TaxID=2726739 RepID=UPI001456C4D9|nr:hypothetical protein [Rhizobium sp. P40RR-XXII]NLS19872.1 hypothetical protein [Rhizobium sp. P40RR-XXII]
MSDVLLGLQYCAGAFGIILAAIVCMLLLMWVIRLIYGSTADPTDIGAPEGDPRNFRLRSIDDDHFWEDL